MLDDISHNNSLMHKSKKNPTVSIILCKYKLQAKHLVFFYLCITLKKALLWTFPKNFYVKSS
ncbi:hypothetical protein EZS27_027935, partial [termite gut metagenome]